jgi:hypothetical protein
MRDGEKASSSRSTVELKKHAQKVGEPFGKKAS